MANPEKVFENGGCRAAVFLNEIEGQETKIPKIVISRSYMDKNNEWKSTNSFNTNDLPKLIMIATKTYDYLTSKSRAQQNPNSNEDDRDKSV